METGGSKVVCAIGTGPDDVRARVRIPTGEPSATLREAVAFFRQHTTPVAAIGAGAGLVALTAALTALAVILAQR